MVKMMNFAISSEEETTGGIYPCPDGELHDWT